MKLWRFRALVCSYFCLQCLCWVGCSSTAIRGDAIPSNLLAKPSVNMEEVDISSMGVKNIRNDLIYVGDVIECVIKTGASSETEHEKWESRVASDGTIDVPFVGPVQVVGQTVEVAEDQVKQASVARQVYRNPTVRLDIKDRQVNSISVMGAVNKPGVYDLPTAGSNLVAALNAAGGILEEAYEFVEIHDPIAQTNGVEPIRVNLAEASQSSKGNLYLNDGAVIRVSRQSEDYVYVLGNAQNNKSILLPPDRDVRVLDALATVGGLRYSAWICDKIAITRTDPQTQETVQIEISAKKAMKDNTENIVLAPGDIISVKENPVTFTLNTVKGLMGVGASAAMGAGQLR